MYVNDIMSSRQILQANLTPAAHPEYKLTSRKKGREVSHCTTTRVPELQEHYSAQDLSSSFSQAALLRCILYATN